MTNARHRDDPPPERDPNDTMPGAAPVAFAPHAPDTPHRTGPLQEFTDPSLRATSSRQRGFRTLMRNRYFLRLWLAQLISQTIMNAANYALIIVTQKSGTGSFTAAAGAIVAFSLPALLFGAPAGVLVDRFDRRLVLWISNLLRAIACVIFAGVLIVDAAPLLPVYMLAFFIALVGQFFTPAEGAAIPLLVKREELIHALSLFNITFTLAQAGGLIILGPLMLALVPTFQIGSGAQGIEITSRQTLFIVIAILYMVCVGLIISIPKARMTAQATRDQQDVLFAPKEMSQVRRVYVSILQTGNFIRKDRRLLITVAQLALGGSIVAVIAMIAPGFVEEFFNKPAELAALVFVPAGAGLVIGSAITPNVARALGYRRTIAVGVIVLAASAALLAGVHAVAPHLFGAQTYYNAPLYLIVMLLLTFAIGIGLDFVNVPAQTMLQERSPDWIKGRVLAVQAMLLNGVTIPFVLVMGRIADGYGLSLAILALAGIIASTGLLSVYISSRREPGETPAVSS
ncbi:MAG: MFS transporter [Nitrososphaerota archaeon]